MGRKKKKRRPVGGRSSNRMVSNHQSEDPNIRRVKEISTKGSLGWSIVAFIISVAVSGFALALELDAIPRMGLGISLLYNTPLVGVAKDIRRDVAVYYKGKRSDNINKAVVLIKNRGNQVIRMGNVKKPVLITMPGSVVLFTNSIPKPPECESRAYKNHTDESSVLFIPNDMERNDQVVCEVYYSGPITMPVVSGLIASPRYKCTLAETTFLSVMWPVLVILALFPLLVFLNEYYKKLPRKTGRRLLMMLAVNIFFICVGTALFIRTVKQWGPVREDMRLRQSLFEKQ